MHLTPVIKRIALAKFLGIVIGLLSAWSLATGDAVRITTLLGVAAAYLTLGTLIGVGGFYNRFPVGDIPMPSWLRGAWSGAWFGLLMVLLAHDALAPAVAAVDWMPEILRSPWRMILDATVAGAAIDILVTCGVGRVNWPDSGVSS